MLSGARWCCSAAAWTRRRRSPSPSTRATTVYALSFRYGQRHAVELEAAARVAAALRRRAARRRRDRPARLRRLRADRRHRRAQGPRRRRDGRTGIPITYVPARNTIFLSFALAWAEVLESLATSSSASTRSTTRGYPDCRPEYIDAYERMANLATKAGVEGTQRLTIHTPLLAADQGADHPARR